MAYKEFIWLRARWIDADGTAHPMTPNDVMVVAPYNRQVSLLCTVDADHRFLRGRRLPRVDAEYPEERCHPERLILDPLPSGEGALA
jgi:hypothetical protein